MKKEKEKNKKSFHKDAQQKRDNKLDNDTLNELRKKKAKSLGIYLISVLSRLRQIKWSIFK